MQIHDIHAPKGAHKRRKIVGRGPGSGHGKTSCRGQKGQNSRSGRGVILGSEGGQVPMIKRLPKVGFRPKTSTMYQIVKIESLARFKENTVVDAEFLKSQGLIRNVTLPYKILGDGELKKPFIIHANRFSKSAQEKIAKAGGKAEFLDKEYEQELRNISDRKLRDAAYEKSKPVSVEKPKAAPVEKSKAVSVEKPKAVSADKPKAVSAEKPKVVSAEKPKAQDKAA